MHFWIAFLFGLLCLFSYRCGSWYCVFLFMIAWCLLRCAPVYWSILIRLNRIAINTTLWGEANGLWNPKRMVPAKKKKWLAGAGIGSNCCLVYLIWNDIVPTHWNKFINNHEIKQKHWHYGKVPAACWFCCFQMQGYPNNSEGFGLWYEIEVQKQRWIWLEL